MDSRRGRRFDHGGRRFRRGGGRGSGRGSGHVWFKGEGYTDHESVSISEEVAGISGFLTPDQKGFPGVVKQRFADFVVHELNPKTHEPVTLQSVARKGKSASLAFHDKVLDFALGVVGPRDEGRRQEEKQDKDGVIAAVRLLARKLQHISVQQLKQGMKAQEVFNLKQLVLLVTREIGDKKGQEFQQFLDKVELARVDFEAKRQQTQEAGTSAALAAAEGLTFYLGGLNEKADRVFIHETMRRYGKTRIVADTLNIGTDTAVIRVRPQFAVKLLPGERDSRRDWPVGQPDYLQFTLYKRNKDTSAVINQLASMLKVSPALFSYADVKDKRGITTQLCTAYRVPKDRAQVVFRPGGTKKLEDQQHLVGDLRYVSRKLELGDCAGNRIEMVVRSLPENDKELPEKAVRQAVRSWETRGFINFFGLQRFGNASTSYQVLGRAMLRKDYKLAVLLLLRPQDGEASKIRAAREHFRQHKDVAAALRMLPPFLIPERAVLEGLQQHGIDAHELAFNNIPKPLRVSYVEAYQDFVWNEMASMRVAKFSSTAAVVGDLVLVQNDDSKTSKKASEPAGKRQRTGKSTRRQPLPEVMELTEANVAQYSIQDIVLPLPGYAVKYPTNEVGAAYRKMLTTDGIDLNAHFGPDGSQTYELDGSYRHVVKKPTRVSFRLERYSDPTKPLISKDVDALLANSPALQQDAVNAPESPAKEEVGEAAHRALVLGFDLGYGSDATIAIRELMKQSSSAHVNWQTPSSEAAGIETTKAADDSVSGGSKTGASTKKAGRGDARKIIKAQKKTQVAIGRPGFSLGRS